MGDRLGVAAFGDGLGVAAFGVALGVAAFGDGLGVATFGVALGVAAFGDGLGVAAFGVTSFVLGVPVEKSSLLTGVRGCGVTRKQRYNITHEKILTP